MKVSVVGLGKLGSPLAALLASKGHHVIGIDFNREIVSKLNEGVAPFYEPGLQALLSDHGSNLQATTDYQSAISETDVTFVIVPTPSEKDGLFSNRYILQAIEGIGGVLKQKKGYTKCVSHETVYKYIWANKQAGGSLYKELRHNGKKYNKRSKGAAGRGCIPGRIDIDERPDIVEEKVRLGDWELDTIIGAGQSGAIVSMVDRTSKLTKLAKVSQKTAEEVKEALVENLRPFQDFVLTLTADNGKEFAYHKEVSHCLETSFYFAKPYHSWERGLNEHTNGLVRQYLPKGKRFDDVSSQSLMEIEILLNNRPRKVLNFATPLEVFSQLSRGVANVALQN